MGTIVKESYLYIWFLEEIVEIGESVLTINLVGENT